MSAFLDAVRFLTILPAGAPRRIPEGAAGRIAAAFPLVGVVLALAAWGFLAAQGFAFDAAPGLDRPPALLDVLLVLALATVLTGGLHLDGLGDAFDALGSRKGAEGALAIMRDSRVGTYGVLAVGFDVALKAVLLLAVGGSAEAMLWALALALAVGRWGMTLGCVCGRYARSEGLAASFLSETQPHHALVAAVAPVAVAVFCPHVFFADVQVFGAVAAGGAVAWGWTRLCMRRFGGVTGDTLGAGNELAELACLYILVRLA